MTSQKSVNRTLPGIFPNFQKQSAAIGQPSALAPNVEMGKFSKPGKNSGRDGVRATFNLVQSTRHQHCKYDGNEN